MLPIDAPSPMLNCPKSEPIIVILTLWLDLDEDGEFDGRNKETEGRTYVKACDMDKLYPKRPRDTSKVDADDKQSRESGIRQTMASSLIHDVALQGYGPIRTSRTVKFRDM